MWQRTMPLKHIILAPLWVHQKMGRPLCAWGTKGRAPPGGTPESLGPGPATGGSLRHPAGRSVIKPTRSLHEGDIDPSRPLEGGPGLGLEMQIRVAKRRAKRLHADLAPWHWCAHMCSGVGLRTWPPDKGITLASCLIQTCADFANRYAASPSHRRMWWMRGFRPFAPQPRSFSKPAQSLHESQIDPSRPLERGPSLGLKMQTRESQSCFMRTLPPGTGAFMCFPGSLAVLAPDLVAALPLRCTCASSAGPWFGHANCDWRRWVLASSNRPTRKRAG